LVALREGLESHGKQALSPFFKLVNAPLKLGTKALEEQHALFENCSLEALLSGLDFLEKENVRDGLGEVSQPSCIFHGCLDQVIPLVDGFKVACALGGPVRMHLLPDAGHNLVASELSEVRSNVEQFLNAH